MDKHVEYFITKACLIGNNKLIFLEIMANDFILLSSFVVSNVIGQNLNWGFFKICMEHVHLYTKKSTQQICR